VAERAEEEPSLHIPADTQEEEAIFGKIKELIDSLETRFKWKITQDLQSRKEVLNVKINSSDSDTPIGS